MKQLEGIETSLELYHIINKHREDSGVKVYRNHADFVTKIKRETGSDLSAHDFVWTSPDQKGQGVKDIKSYRLSRKEVYTVSMRESSVVRSAVYDYIENLEEQNRIMQSIVWEVINGQAFLSQELALKSSGCDHPRLFMKFLKRNPKFYSSVLDRSYLQTRQCNQHGDRWWKFSKAGFKWLVANKDTLNTWVKEQKELDKLNKVLPA